MKFPILIFDRNSVSYAKAMYSKSLIDWKAPSTPSNPNSSSLRLEWVKMLFTRQQRIFHVHWAGTGSHIQYTFLQVQTANDAEARGQREKRRRTNFIYTIYIYVYIYIYIHRRSMPAGSTLNSVNVALSYRWPRRSQSYPINSTFSRHDIFLTFQFILKIAKVFIKKIHFVQFEK